MKSFAFFNYILLLIVTLMVSACGGGADHTTTTNSPADTSQSVSTNASSEENAFTITFSTNNRIYQQALTTEYLASLPRLVWPDDFPVLLETGDNSEGAIVTGIPVNTVVDIEVAPQAEGEDAEPKLFALNYPGLLSPVCFDSLNCSGTVRSDSVFLQLLAGNSSPTLVSITRSTDKPALDEGSEDEPVIIDLSSGNVSVTGSIGPMQATFYEGIPGESYYRVSNLLPGRRYVISVSSGNSNDYEVTWQRSDTREPLCDPFTTGYRCVLVAEESTMDLKVYGDFAFYGAVFTISAVLESEPDEIRGAWNNPIKFQTPLTGRSFLYDSAGKYRSYYHLDNLDENRLYRVSMTGITDNHSLNLYSPFSREIISHPQICKRVYSSSSPAPRDEACLLENSNEAFFMVRTVYTDRTSYLLTVEVSLQNEGSEDSPINLAFQTPQGVLYEGQMLDSSFYRINGLEPGSHYLLQLNASDQQPDFELKYPDGEPVVCAEISSSRCLFSANESILLLDAKNTDSELGQNFTLTVTPVSSGVPALNSSLYRGSIPVAELPLREIASATTSVYTVTDLTPGTYYIAQIKDLSGDISPVLYHPGTAEQVYCYSARSPNQGSGCLLQAIDDSIQLRVETTVGGRFTVAVREAMEMLSGTTSNHAPITIPDSSTQFIESTIEVSETSVIENIYVDLIIDHDRPNELSISLLSPDGQSFSLADTQSGGPYVLTGFTDPAPNLYHGTDPWRSKRFASDYRPISPFHVLRGTSSAGEWRLRVKDKVYTWPREGEDGVLVGWSIAFRQ